MQEYKSTKKSENYRNSKTKNISALVFFHLSFLHIYHHLHLVHLLKNLHFLPLVLAHAKDIPPPVLLLLSPLFSPVHLLPPNLSLQNCLLHIFHFFHTCFFLSLFQHLQIMDLLVGNFQNVVEQDGVMR